MTTMPKLSLYLFAFLTLVPIIWNVDAGVCLALLIAHCAAGVWVVWDVDEDNKNKNKRAIEDDGGGMKCNKGPSLFTKIKVDI